MENEKNDCFLLVFFNDPLYVKRCHVGSCELGTFGVGLKSTVNTLIARYVPDPPAMSEHPQYRQIILSERATLRFCHQTCFNKHISSF